MDFGRLRIGEWIAAASGVALLLFMFLLAWYGAEPKEAGDAFVSGKAEQTAWEAFSVLDIVLALTAVMALVLVVLTATQRTPALPIAFVSITTLVALVAFVWLVIRAAAPPSPEGDNLETTRSGGLWLGLAATAGILAGALAGMRDESPGLRKPSPMDAPERPPSVPATTLPHPWSSGERSSRP